MLKSIRTMLDYKCYPVWLYDENGDVIDTLLPEELRNDKELDAKFDNLQGRYDSLFVDNEHEFLYVGFKTEAEKEKFLSDWNLAVTELRQKVKGKYPITDEIELSGI